MGYYLLLRGQTIIAAGVYASLAAFGVVAKPVSMNGDLVRFIPTAPAPAIAEYTVTKDCDVILTPI